MSTYSNRPQPALQILLQHVVQFFYPRSSCTTTHISAVVQSITLMLHAWRSRVEEPNNSIYSAASLALWVIFIRFIVVELNRFFHGAIHLPCEEILMWLSIKECFKLHVHVLVTVMVEPENEEVEFLWKRSVVFSLFSMMHWSMQKADCLAYGSVLFCWKIKTSLEISGMNCGSCWVRSILQ